LPWLDSRAGIRGIALTAACISSAIATTARADAADRIVDPVRVFYDGGDCGTEAIEIEVFDRAAAVWITHPDHPRVPVPSCQVEDAGGLLNELRWRCFEPDAGDFPPPWRNLAVFEPEVLSHCVLQQILEGERQRIRDAKRKRMRDAQRKRLELRPDVEPAKTEREKTAPAKTERETAEPVQPDAP
jgi:hypothetical protein